MTTAKAVETLRRKLGDSQRTFAKKLGTTITTVSRYENGRIGISEEALRKIAGLAESAGLTDLQKFFESQRNLAIVARVESLPSAGAQRRVSLDDLQRWRDMSALMRERVREARQYYEAIVPKCPPEDRQGLEGTNRLLYAIEANLAGELAKLIELYINTPTKKGKNP